MFEKVKFKVQKKSECNQERIAYLIPSTIFLNVRQRLDWIKIELNSNYDANKNDFIIKYGWEYEIKLGKNKHKKEEEVKKNINYL